MTARPTVAFCGAGTIAGVHAAVADRLGWRPVGVASRTAASAERLAARLAAPVLTPDELPGRADVVVVATPPARHAADALRAMAGGAAALVEKPLCTTLADADRLVEAADRGGRLLYAENLLAAPVVIEFVRRARDIGALSFVEVRSIQPRPTYGGFLTDEWGGGALFDLGAHPLAVALLVAGSVRATRVSATLLGGEGHRADEHAEVTISFEGGLRARVVASWRGGPDAVCDIQASSASSVVRAEVLPTPALEVGGEPVAATPGSANDPLIDLGYVGQAAGLADDLAGGRTPVPDVRFGRRVLELTCAAYLSAGRGEPVPLPFGGSRHHTPLDLWRNPPR